MTDLNFHKFLPPSQNSNAKFGYFKINIENLILSSNYQQSLAVKIQFWGEAHPLYLPIEGSQIFHISTSLIKFKHYLIDCKVSQFEIVDSRNYKPIAVAYLNWLTYLRPIEDKQIYCEKVQKGSKPSNPYYLPFFDQIMEIQLPIYRSPAQGIKAKKQEKIGELMLKLQCRVYEAEAGSNNNISHLQSGNNFFNIRVSGVGNRKTQLNPVSITNIDLQDQIGPQFKTNKSIISNKLQPNNLRVYSIDNHHQSRKSNNSLLDGGYLRKVKQQRQQPQFSSRTKQSQKGKNNNQLDLELIRMRFQMQQLVGQTKKQQMISLQVLHFETISKIINSKDVISCDIKSEAKGKVSSWRLFPENITQQKVLFGSAITLKQGAILSVVIAAKKGKQLIRGSVNLDIILETYDINISSNQGVIVGYVRVKVDRQTSVDAKQRPLREKIDQIKQISFTEKKPFPEPVKIIRKQIAKRQQIKNDDEQIIRQQQKNTIQAYYLLLINQNGSIKLNRFKFKSFDMQIGQNNNQKFILTPQITVINKPLLLQVYEKDTCIMNQILIQQLLPTPISIYNLTCSLVFQKRFSNFDGACQLYSGNIQQINYLIQKIMTQRTHLQPRRKIQEPSRPLVTQQSNRNSLVAQFQQQINRQQNRKLKTQAYGVQNRERMLTEQKISGQSIAIDKFENVSQNNQAQDQNIYLVDLFTRFLQCLPQLLKLDTQYISREDFLQIILPQIQNSTFQIELVEIIISIFQESSNDSINCLALMQCHKAFRSFWNLYQTQRTELLTKILLAEPKAIEKIKSSAQLGTLNESVLWGRALTRIKDSVLKQRINKLYKISAFGSIDAALLLQDLDPRNKQIRSLDISNLGMMIKQWVEDFILKTETQNILNLKQKLLSLGQQDNIVNIRSVSDTVQVTLGLRLSLWESLMLIEEIKGSYGCDNQLQQGVISSVSLANWIDGVRRRAKVSGQNSHISDSQVSLDEEELAMIKQIKKQPKNISTLSKKDVGKHRSESISQLALNNESDIADIANLLREKDGFMNMDLIQQTQNDYKQKMFDPQIKYPQFLIPDQTLKNKQHQEYKKINKDYSSQSQEQNNKDIINIPKEKQQIKKQKVVQFSIKVQQLKLYNETSLFPLYKEIISFQNQQKKITQQYFYYVTMGKKFSQSNGKGNKFIIAAGNRVGTIKIALHDQENNLKFSGILPLQQVSDCITKKEENRKKTIVLYESNRKIGGKIVIHFNFQKQDIYNSVPIKESNIVEDSQKVYITLNKIAPANKQLQLFAKIQQSGEQKALYLNEQIELSLNKPVYHCQLKIFDESNSLRSLISLQELFIRHVIRQSYPLIDVNAGNYIATLSLTLSYNSKNGNLVQSRQQQIQQSISNLKQDSINQIQKDKQLILINSVIAFGYKDEYKFTPKLHCIISNNQRDDNYQKLALVTPQFNLKIGGFGTKYQFKHQKIDIENYEQCFLQLKLVQSGRTICYSQKFKLSQVKNSINSNIIIMSNIGDNNALFAVSFKKIGFSEDRFMLRRLINCLQQVPLQLQYKNIDSLIKTLKETENLTITEQNMLKSIFENNLSTKNYIINNASVIQTDFSFIYKYSNFQRAKHINEILSEFIHFDIQVNKKITGYLKVKQLNEIFISLAQQLPKKLIEQIQDTNRQINNLEQLREKNNNNKMNYMWLLIGIEENKETQTLQFQEKRHILSQIDGIYESLKLRYG